ncbi:MAG: hypothetical protein KGL39_53740 [Patescibacteria group bacterium]|nr:hypothetical protein [Patescibacteria group bacterium]
MKSWLAFQLLLPAIIAGGCSTTVMTHGVPNLRQVTPMIWRGGQPTAEGWRYLTNELHVTSDVKLNAGHDGVAIHEVDIPISFTEQMMGPKSDKMDRIQEAMAGDWFGITFIHCTHGQDRTGLAVAEYRVHSLNWSRKKARKEMLLDGFHRSLIGLDWYWRTNP